MTLRRSPVRIIIYDIFGNKAYDLQDEIASIRWGYVNPGGCSDASFVVNWEFSRHEEFNLFNRVQIYYDGEKRWEGYIVKKKPVYGDENKVEVICFGYVNKLHYRVVKEEHFDNCNFRVGTIILRLLQLYPPNGIIAHPDNIEGSHYI